MKNKNKGYILPIGLIILLILTIVVLFGVKNAIIQERESGNQQDQQIAFQNAENALRLAEQYIINTINPNAAFNNSCNAGLCLPSLTGTQNWNSISWATDTTHTIALTTTLTGAYSQPKFIIELLDKAPLNPGSSMKISTSTSGGASYRVTVVAWGNRSGSQTMLQSIFVKR